MVATFDERHTPQGLKPLIDFGEVERPKAKALAYLEARLKPWVT